MSSHSLLDVILQSGYQRKLSNDDGDDDETGTWDDLQTGERVAIIAITIISIVLCSYFWYYISWRKETPNDRFVLTGTANVIRG